MITEDFESNVDVIRSQVKANMSRLTMPNSNLFEQNLPKFEEACWKETQLLLRGFSCVSVYVAKVRP